MRIETTGRPTFCRPRRLLVEKHVAAKKESNFLAEAGIGQSSKASGVVGYGKKK